jgi:sensor histidine kinase YesM
MRFKSLIAFEFNVTKELDLNEIEIPPMLIQPFVENAFIHAFDSKSIQPKLEIIFKQNGNILVCEIKDNGKGISKENLNSLHKSKGIKLAKERMKLSQQGVGESVYINSIPNKGTSVILKFIGSE